jgi:hypothetical protein
MISKRARRGDKYYFNITLSEVAEKKLEKLMEAEHIERASIVIERAIHFKFDTLFKADKK